MSTPGANTRAQARTAVAQWFDGGFVEGLNTVKSSVDKIDVGQELQLGLSDNGSGAIGEVFIELENESRASVGGDHSGWKRVSYNIGLIVHFASVTPSALDAMDAYDSLIDGIKARLRSDRTMGGAVWQVGETGGIEVQSDLPVADNNGMVYIWSVVRFQIWGWVLS